MSDLSIIVSRGQKRILDWKKEFDRNYKLSPSDKKQIYENLSTLNSLYGKLLIATGKELEETEKRIFCIESEINYLFNDSRLFTSTIGTPAIQA